MNGVCKNISSADIESADKHKFDMYAIFGSPKSKISGKFVRSGTLIDEFLVFLSNYVINLETKEKVQKQQISLVKEYSH